MRNIYLIISLLILVVSCNNDDDDTVNPCNLQPDSGPCEALIPRYYFDKTEGLCKEFNWGGCDGVVPFETLEACKNECESN